jgi:hypothetical protein
MASTRGWRTGRSATFQDHAGSEPSIVCTATAALRYDAAGAPVGGGHTRVCGLNLRVCLSAGF